MSKKKKNKKVEEDLIKINALISSENEIPAQNSPVAAYRYFILLFLVILATLASMLLLRFMERKFKPVHNNRSNENPLFHSADEIDNGIPDIPGVKVYDAKNDIPELSEDAQSRETQFNNHIRKLEKNNSNNRELNTIKQRNSIAAEKLELLKKIENAQTAEEKNRLIKEANAKFGYKKP